MTTKTLLAAMVVLALLAGCSTAGRLSQPAQDLLVLRVTWQEPARQAGVLESAERHVRRLDAAIASGDLLQVRAVLLSLEPVYMQIYNQVTDPTPEQTAFHARAASLWEAIRAGEADRWLELAGLVLVELARVTARAVLKP